MKSYDIEYTQIDKEWIEIREDATADTLGVVQAIPTEFLRNDLGKHPTDGWTTQTLFYEPMIFWI